MYDTTAYRDELRHERVHGFSELIWLTVVALVALHEGGSGAPASMDLPEDYLRQMMRGIIAFEIPITRLEGKFKLSQNRMARDRERVIEALAESADPGAQGIQAAMRILR